MIYYNKALLKMYQMILWLMITNIQ
jgi:hypothetical protein